MSTTAEDKTSKALFERLQRIETRVVRGFTELGAKVTDDEEWCRVDNEKRVVHLKGGGRSIKSIQLAILSAGGYAGYYDVYIAGEHIGTVKLSEKGMKS